MLQLKNLTCARNENILFKNVSVALKPGQVLQIIGANGCGKTTLLRTIAGLLRPYAGTIALGNMRIGYVGHKTGLHPDLTVLQNLEFLYILETAPVTSIEYALTYFALNNKQQVKCSELSAGQMQRLSLSRLLFTSAQLWLLDEPLANLDMRAIKLLGELCNKHLAANGSLVVATHNILDFAPHVVTTLELEQYMAC